MDNDTNYNHTLEEKIVDVADVIVIIMVGAALLVTAFIFLVRGQHGHTVTKNSQHASSTGETVAPENRNPYQALSLEAKAVYVYDVTGKKVLFEKNSDAVLPLASLTKIMTALTVLDTIPKNSEITIDAEAMKQDGDTGLAVGERWPLDRLLDFTLVVSSNDGASALALASAAQNHPEPQTEGDRTATFIDAMNAEARKIGLTTLRFTNETGLDTPDGRPGGVGSAKEVAGLIQYALSSSPETMEATRHARVSIASETMVHDAVNTNTIIRSIPGILASKTGYSDLAGGNLAIAYDAGIGEPIIIVVLGSSYDGRFSDMKALLNATQTTIAGIPTE